MSIRKLFLRIRQLPASSALVRAVSPDSEWTAAEHLLATAIDVLQIANWQRGGDAKAKRPQPLPRPGDQRRSEERSVQHLERWRASRQSEG